MLGKRFATLKHIFLILVVMNYAKFYWQVIRRNV